MPSTPLLVLQLPPFSEFLPANKSTSRPPTLLLLCADNAESPCPPKSSTGVCCKLSTVLLGERGRESGTYNSLSDAVAVHDLESPVEALGLSGLCDDGEGIAGLNEDLLGDGGHGCCKCWLL